MSTPDTEIPVAISAAEVARRERLERHALRTARSATIAAWAGAVTSLCAVLISVYSAYLQREQTRATFWPNLELSFSDAPTPRLQLLNTGVGPAVLQWVALRHDGKPMRSWGQLLKAAGAAPDELRYAYSTIGTTRTIRAGEVVDVLIPNAANETGPQPDLALRTLNRIRGNAAVALDLCYCSIFDECSLLLADRAAQPVPQCPSAREDDFED